MISNIDSIKDKFGCNKIVADYLIYEKNLPLLGLKDGRYFFTYNYDLWKVIKEFPIWIRLANVF
jgi:hypothetical protein